MKFIRRIIHSVVTQVLLIFFVASLVATYFYDQFFWGNNEIRF